VVRRYKAAMPTEMPYWAKNGRYLREGRTLNWFAFIFA